MDEKLINLTKILTEITRELTKENITDIVDTLVTAASISGISAQVGNCNLAET